MDVKELGNLFFSLIFFINSVTNHIPFLFFHGDEIVAAFHSEQISDQLGNIPIVDHEKLTMFINQLDRQIRKQPIDATIDQYGKIVDEKAGYIINRERLKVLIIEHLFKDTPANIQIPTIPIYPKVTSELLSSIRTKRIGQYSTYFNTNNESRATNIALATEAINNQVVFPGETFSFNEVVGERTERKGYQKAAEIVRGELSEGIGGGICQVSSTLFNAVEPAGFQIIQRYSHSRRVPYVPPGRDATVSWYGPDFTFKNNGNAPILIRAESSWGRVNVFIYSSDSFQIKTGAVQ